VSESPSSTSSPLEVDAESRDGVVHDPSDPSPTEPKTKPATDATVEEGSACESLSKELADELSGLVGSMRGSILKERAI
jgi:hypothetical protein